MTTQESAQDVFARATLVTDGQAYRLLRLPPAAIIAAAGVLAEIGTPFSALLADDQEVTLLVPQEEWEAFETRLPDIDEGGLYRLITFDAALDPTLTGFLARVTEVLATGADKSGVKAATGTAAARVAAHEAPGAAKAEKPKRAAKAAAAQE